LEDYGPQNISQEKYLLLETYRKNNLPVRTPIWFVIHNNLIHIVTREKTGKIKRLRNNNCVRIALCTFNGKIRGKWMSGTVTFSSSEDSQIIMGLRRKKYGFAERIARLVSRKKGDFIIFSIRLDE